MAKIMIIAGLGSSLLRFRGDLIKSWLDMGHQVIAAAPEDQTPEKLAKLGVSYHSIKLKRSGLNPAADLVLWAGLKKIILREKPDYLYLYTVKPVIYGSLAAKFNSKIKVYSMITGLGYVFSSGAAHKTLLKRILIALYRIALAGNNKVIFQNYDDSKTFLALNLVRPGQVVQVNGSGVNIKDYHLAPLPDNQASFLMIARLLREKGFLEFVEAARMVKRKYPQARFMLLGWSLADSPSSITAAELASWREEGIVELFKETDDVRPYIADTAVYVLPSYYGEGKPRTILEAMAMGRPVITTDAPGCRETVMDGINGFVVPVKDSRALGEAMEKLIEKPELTARMGAESRRLAEEKYDVEKVNREINRAMGLI